MLSIEIALEGVRSMRKIPVLAQLSVLSMLCIASAPCAQASTVNATDDIYMADGQVVTGGILDPGSAPSGSEIVLIGPGITSYEFSVTGQIILDNGSGANLNNADGVGAAVLSSSNTGWGSLSGLTAPGAGYLVGVFINTSTFAPTTGSPGAGAPPALNFLTGSGPGTIGFASLSPALDQVFYIGDGLTGNGTGVSQVFWVPTGATELYLGISDANVYNGMPDAYGDNSGSYDVTATPFEASPVPEPSSLMLFGTGILGIVEMLRRKHLAK
jgi:hypothetical protein